MTVVIVDKVQRTLEGSANDGHLIKIFYSKLRRNSKLTKEQAAKTMDSMFTEKWKEFCIDLVNKDDSYWNYR